MKKDFLMIAGPMPLHPEVLASLSQPIISHRSKDFSEIFLQTVELAKKVFKTNNQIFILPCSGSGGLEAVISNLMSPGDKVLVCVNGFFGERFKSIMLAYSIKPIILEKGWGEPINTDDVISILKKDPEIKSVFIVHNESSTGVISNIKEISKEIKKLDSNILVIIDAVSSLGGTDIQTDEWSLDVVVAASQKALMAPPGLCLISISDTAWKRINSSKSPRWYFDLRLIKEEGSRGMTLVTPSIPIIIALRKALQILLEEGLDNVFNRNLLIRNMIIEAIELMDLKLLGNRRYASPTVTTVKLPPNINPEVLIDYIANEYSVIFAPGLGRIANETFRIGHMGYIFPNDVIVAISALEKSIKHFRNVTK
ncbi:aminotransferase [Candidatus Atribacteria bacterium HGW-Atribacteria-1]|nr:MAG: aminotransferase [Candidatus Atribacteria bacterium HGW-Atribacteria-1]